MNLVNRIRKRLVTSYHSARFNQIARGVLETKPLLPGDLPFVTLSMVQHKDVLAYLVAVKSFARHVHSSRVVVICDPTINSEDRALLKQQIPHIELRDAVEFRHNSIPVGGCWERLSAITTYANENQVVQLDADTVTTGPLNEVVEAIRNGRGFVLGEERNQNVLTLAEAAENSKDWSDKHIQAVAEKSMALALPPENRYIRGCAGFTGFPIRPTLGDEMRMFSDRMSNFVGIRWREWGTEQVASNYLVANCKETQILPFPKYSTPPNDIDAVAFHHFIGHIRFGDARYAKATQRALSQLHS